MGSSCFLRLWGNPYDNHFCGKDGRMKQEIINDLVRYARHKGTCGLTVVPATGHIDDDGRYVSDGGGFAVTKKCTCGFSEMIGKANKYLDSQDWVI